MTTSNDALSSFPRGWIWTKLGEIAEVIRGASPRPKGDPRYFGGTIPWIMISDISKEEGKFISKTRDTVTEEGAKKSRLLKAGTLILSNSGTVCVPKILAVDGCIHDGFVAFPDLTKSVKMLYLYYYFDFIRPRIIQENRQGVTQVNLNTNIVRNMDVPLPPLAEQGRIVGRVEELFSILDAGVESLRKVKAQLKRYRQAVLKYAFEGKLTEEWRKTHEDKTEPISALLERILENRRTTWEAYEIVKMRKQRKIPEDDSWKRKYRKPVLPDISSLPELPEGWMWINWNQISVWVTYGFTRPMPHISDGIPIVTAKNIVNRKIDFVNTDRTTKEAFNCLSDKDRPERGDILITKDGTIGNAAIVSDDESFCINQSVAVAWLRSCPLNRHYLLAVIESPMTQKLIWAKARGVAIKHLSITDFAKMPVPLPSLEEQDAIARETERCLSIYEEMGKALEQSLRQAERLRQSILKKAFEGKLVPQDSTDEPAEKLLERIKEDKAKLEIRIDGNNPKEMGLTRYVE